MYQWSVEHKSNAKTVVAAFTRCGATRKFFDRRFQVIKEIINFEAKLWNYVTQKK
jgi:hypothetical protein